jgi:RND family efflux transporter MFP subunit
LPTVRPFLLALSSALLLLSACSSDNSSSKSDKKKPPRIHLVETLAVTTQSIAVKTERSGTLLARQQVKIFNQEEGRVSEFSVFEGDKVTAEQILLRLDDTLLRANLDKLVATRKQALAELNRAQSLSKKRLISEDELSRAVTRLRVAEADEELQRARLGYTTVKAPFSGVISERLIEPGDVIPRFTHVLTVLNPDSLYTRVQVSELLLPSLQLSQIVSVRIDALGDHTLKGTIIRIHPTIDDRTRQGTVEVQLNPVPVGALPGQLCRITLDSPVQPRKVIPFSALRRDSEGEYVYIVNSSGISTRRSIRSGLRLNDQVEVLQGLEENEQIVVRGFLGLRDGLTVKTVAPEAGGNKPASN